MRSRRGHTVRGAGRAGSPAGGGCRVRSNRQWLEGRAGLGRGRKDCHLRPQRFGRSGELIGSDGPIGGDENLEPGQREPVTQLVGSVLDRERHRHGPIRKHASSVIGNLTTLASWTLTESPSPTPAARSSATAPSIRASTSVHVSRWGKPPSSVARFGASVSASSLGRASNQSVDRGGFAHCAKIADVTLPHR